MGRKRIDKEKRKEPYTISLPRKTINEFREEAEKRGEIPSHIIEKLIKKYFLNSDDKQD